MKVAVIGGTGHVGTYLVPRLVEAGHEVTSVTRGTHPPYLSHPAWKAVRTGELDREKLEAAGEFGTRVAALGAEAVIDMICFTAESARQMVEALRGRVQHYLACGTIWVHGYNTEAPATEEAPRNPFGEYGIRKVEMERYLLAEARQGGFPATVLHPGHIVGRGWAPVNPQGNFNPAVFSRLAHGQELAIPNLGLETVHHVHAGDVAQAFMRALHAWRVAVGESFHVTSPAALTLRGYAEAAAAWFGREPPVLRFLPWEEWRRGVSEEDGAATWDHIAHSPCVSIEKARRLLGYAPRYTSLEAVQESVEWLADRGIVSTAAKAGT